jgi:hypothetical protein
MSISEPSSRVRHYGWLLLILLAALFLRLHKIVEVPPGLTHDEADHGITAWSIISEGVRDIYFTIGYGREPLYDYATALLMAFLGPTFLAGRITAVFISLILIAGMVAWVWRAFDGQTALLTAAGLAVGFWPVMSGRQALRSILLPSLFVLAVALFWRGLELVSTEKTPSTNKSRRSLLLFLVAGILLGLTFYTYIPARALWIIFPVLLGYLFFTRRSLFRRAWSRTGLMLIVMFLMALPLLLFLERNAAAEVRIQQLATPLTAAAGGDFGPLLQNIQGSMRLFASEGDMAWRYNIAGRPLLGPLMGFLFLAGVMLAVWYAFKRRSDLHYGAASFLALSWLFAGFLPVLVTGPELSMTQAIGMQPLLYLFPALTLLAFGQVTIGGKRVAGSRWASVGLFLLFVATAVITYRDYFIAWANSPEVRVQYETTMATAMDYLNTHGDGVVAVSSITPDRYHSPALGRMLLRNDAVELRWFDARTSVLLPQMDMGRVLISGFTPLPAMLEGYFSTAVLEETLPMRETDLDRPLNIYVVNQPEMSKEWQKRLVAVDASFADAVELLGFDLQTGKVAPGAEVQIVTLWHVKQPLEDAVIFTHVVAPEGAPIAQADQIGVPSYAWHPGDLFLQLHQFTIPPDTPAGSYPLAFGIYTQTDGVRMPLTGGSQTGDLFTVTNLVVTP